MHAIEAPAPACRLGSTALPGRLLRTPATTHTHPRGIMMVPAWAGHREFNSARPDPACASEPGPSEIRRARACVPPRFYRTPRAPTDPPLPLARTPRPGESLVPALAGHTESRPGHCGRASHYWPYARERPFASQLDKTPGAVTVRVTRVPSWRCLLFAE